MTGVADLGLTDINASQNQKEVTANANFETLASAITAAYDANVTSGNVTLTDAQYQKAAVIRATGATTAGRTVTLPAKQRVTIILNLSTNTQTVDFVRGSATITLAIGEAAVIRTDGTTNGLVALMRGAASGFALTDGDKGDITVSSSGTNWQIDAGAVGTTEIADAAVTLAKMANLAQDRVIGRATASTGVPEAITCTAAGRALLDDADAAAQRTTLGLPASVTTLHNFTATTDPTVNDDAGDGYSDGSMWFNKTTGILYLCADPTTTAAIWIPYRAALNLPYRTGTWIGFGAVTALAGTTLAADTMYAVPIPIRWPTRIDMIAITIATGVAGNARLGLPARSPRWSG